MRSFCIFLLFFHSFFGASAQELVAEFPPIAPKIKIDDLLLAHSPTGETGICYSTLAPMVVRIMGKDGILVYQKELDDDRDALLPIGSLDSGDNFQFVYYNDNTEGFNIITANKTDESLVKITTVMPFELKERHIASIISDNELYTIGWNKKSHLLKFGKYNKAEGRFDMKSKAISDELAQRLSKAKIASISNTTIPEPGQAVSKYKLYRNNDGRVAITIEGENYMRCNTEIMLLDCETGQIGVFPVGGPVADNSGVGLTTNSFIHANRLALVRSEKKSLHLSLYELDSLKMVKEYFFTEETPIEIMNSILFSEVAGEPISPDYKELTKENPKKVLKNLSKGSPFVYFEGLADGNFAFTIGNMVVQGGGGGFSPGMPGSNISTPYGNISTPGTPGSFHGYGQSYSQSKYFYSLLEKQSFSPLSGDATQMTFLSKQVRNFVKNRITNRSGGLFATEPEYQIVNISDANYALVVSYLKKEGMIKLHKIEL
jgi:hypothetical protein